MWSSSMHLILSKAISNLADIDASEYCFISKPLHFLGPFSENRRKTILYAAPGSHAHRLKK
jgi:hypothetical protein